MIVCLGWGSLIWDPRNLRLTDRAPAAWKPDGPELPIEFVRQSKDGRLTLVVDSKSAPLRVLWNSLLVASQSEAIETLREREGTPRQSVGRWPGGDHYDCADVIGDWARQNGIGCVVWTALQPQFQGQRGRRPSKDEAIKYLDELPKGARCLAEQYVRRAPTQINTLYRCAFAEQLGWTPTV
jgi:hypothetical protein